MLTVTAAELSKRFGRRTLFDNLSLSITTDQVIGITGGNGSGKSTLSMLLLGQLRPSSGKILWELDGKSLTTDDRRKCSWLVAPYLSWYEPLTAEENLRFVCEVTSTRFDGRLVQSLLEQVGLPGRGDDLVRTYSSGMKQRLKLAAISLLKPALLVLDEPGSTLDVEGHRLIRDGLREWRTFAAVILASNDPQEIALTDSQIQMTGTVMRERSASS